MHNTGYSTDLFHDIYIYSNTFRSWEGNTNSIVWVGHYTNTQFDSSNLQEVYIVNNIFNTNEDSASLSLLALNKISFEDGVFIMNNNSYYRPSGSIRIYWNGVAYTSSTYPNKFVLIHCLQIHHLSIVLMVISILVLQVLV